MTRANVYVITRQGKFKFQANSSAYPSNVMGDIIEFATSAASKNAIFNGQIGFYDHPDSRALSTLIYEMGLTLGEVGNFSFVYEIDFVKQRVKVWNSTTYWVNGPEDWEAKGWNCWKGKNGKYGYTNWKKNKLLFDKHFISLIEDVVSENAVINDNTMKAALECDKD